MQDVLQLQALLEKITTLRMAGTRAKHVSFIFMQRRVHQVMERDHLGNEYNGVDHPSRLHDGDICNELIIERLGKIFKDMPPCTPCLVE
jgi:hypothetical protein